MGSCPEPAPFSRAEFVAGASSLDRLPPPGLPEIAFAGRSNVGKSALLNRLVGRRGLARVSRTPGRTQQINFFAVDDRMVFVDLPGYGFARVPIAIKQGWRRLVEGYLSGRGSLRAVVVLVDGRRGIEADDAQLLDFLTAHGVAALLVVTKVDKLPRSARARCLAQVREQWMREGPIPFSAASGEGVVELRSAVLRLAGGKPRAKRP